MRATVLMATVLALCAAGSATAASRHHAEQRYGARFYQPPPDAAEVDPFFPDDGGAPAAVIFRRHTTRCEYPRGFNVTDFVRNINGIPVGGDRLLATGCGSFEPFDD